MQNTGAPAYFLIQTRIRSASHSMHRMRTHCLYDVSNLRTMFQGAALDQKCMRQMWGEHISHSALPGIV